MLFPPPTPREAHRSPQGNRRGRGTWRAASLTPRIPVRNIRAGLDTSGNPASSGGSFTKAKATFRSAGRWLSSLDAHQPFISLRLGDSCTAPAERGKLTDIACMYYCSSVESGLR